LVLSTYASNGSVHQKKLVQFVTQKQEKLNSPDRPLGGQPSPKGVQRKLKEKWQTNEKRKQCWWTGGGNDQPPFGDSNFNPPKPCDSGRRRGGGKKQQTKKLRQKRR